MIVDFRLGSGCLFVGGFEEIFLINRDQTDLTRNIIINNDDNLLNGFIIYLVLPRHSIFILGLF